MGVEEGGGSGFEALAGGKGGKRGKRRVGGPAVGTGARRHGRE